MQPTPLRSLAVSLQTMAEKGVHACKGQNACKGQGGCKTGDQGCKVKTPAKVRAAALLTAASPNNLTGNSQRARGSGPGLSTPMPANRFQRLHRLRHRHRAARAALPAHSREEAGRRLVRDHLRELHGRRRAPARGARPILEQYRVVQHGVSMYFGTADGSNRDHLKKLKRLDQAHQDAVALRSSLLGQRRRPLHARPCCRCRTRSGSRE